MWAEDTCEKCRHFYAKKNQCRRMPPICQSKYPIVMGQEDWCGEFEGKGSYMKRLTSRR